MATLNKLTDNFNRNINYLRLSVTDRCNLSCVYCTGRDCVPHLTHRDVLTYEELLRISRAALELGITKVRITGGEPLVRHGLVDFLSALTALPQKPYVPLTTNGVRLAELAEPLYKAGVRGLNVSLDTLRPERYARITGHDLCLQVRRGIRAAQAAGFRMVKINVVLMAGVNDDEVLDFARLTMEEPIAVRFIEFMPVGDNSWSWDKLVPSQQVLDQVARLGQLTPLSPGPDDGPARRYRFQGACGELGIISPMSQHHCPSCNRLRITPEGTLKTCLFSDEEIDLRAVLRGGAGDAELKEVMRDAVNCKPEGIPQHSRPSTVRKCLRSMKTIGG